MSNLSAGLLITGNEVLSAKTKDTNGPFMGMHLRKIGVPVRASMMCADDETDILDCLNYLSERCKVIFMTGGLGPTSDDLTSEIVAKFFEVKTVFYEEAWQNCLDAYKKFSRSVVPESNKKQAYLPENSKILANKIGTAVGFKVTGKKHGKKVSVYCMPGVPFEMEAMFLKEVYPEMTNKNFSPITKTWQVFLLGESAMQSLIDKSEKKLLEKFPHSGISYQAHPGYVTYSISIFPQSETHKAECEKFLQTEYIPEVNKCFHKHIMYSQDVTLGQYIVSSFKQKSSTLSFVEGSCGGALTKELSGIKNAEDVMTGSVILQGNRRRKKELTQALYEDMSDIKQLEFMKADICVTEWGAPALELSTNEIPHGHFNLVLSIKKEIIKNDFELAHKLESFNWKKESELEPTGRINYYCEMKVSTRYQKEVQQMRVALHCLCTLALIVNFL